MGFSLVIFISTASSLGVVEPPDELPPDSEPPPPQLINDNNIMQVPNHFLTFISNSHTFEYKLEIKR
jgi:hypothetical protein